MLRELELLKEIGQQDYESDIDESAQYSPSSITLKNYMMPGILTPCATNISL
jgi:hypothetical protein